MEVAYATLIQHEVGGLVKKGKDAPSRSIFDVYDNDRQRSKTNRKTASFFQLNVCGLQGQYSGLFQEQSPLFERLVFTSPRALCCYRYPKGHTKTVRDLFYAFTIRRSYLKMWRGFV